MVKSRQVLTIAKYFLDNKSTVRATANHFGINKSFVHRLLTETLKDMDYKMYAEVRKLLEHNKEVRHIRGGIATKEKFLQLV